MCMKPDLQTILEAVYSLSSLCAHSYQSYFQVIDTFNHNVMVERCKSVVREMTTTKIVYLLK